MRTPSPIPDGVLDTATRLYESVWGLDVVVGVLLDAVAGTTGVRLPSIVTVIVLVALLVGAVGHAFVRLVVALLPAVVAAAVIGLGLGTVVWVAVTPGALQGGLAPLVRALSLVGVLVFGGVLTAALDLRALAEDVGREGRR